VSLVATIGDLTYPVRTGDGATVGTLTVPITCTMISIEGPDVAFANIAAGAATIATTHIDHPGCPADLYLPLTANIVGATVDLGGLGCCTDCKP
jgi:hypothetical protein